MTTDQILDDIVQKEGGYADNPADHGGPTNFGISSNVLGEWRRLGRSATRAEVQALTIVEARQIYRRRYVQPFELVPFDGLRAQLVDIGVNQGPVTAVRLLQGVLGVPVDGIYGERTRAAVAIMPQRLTNAALVAVRVQRYSDLAEHEPSQRQFLRGWIVRAVSFLEVAV